MTEVELRDAADADLEAVQAVVDRAYSLYAERMERPAAPVFADYAASIRAGRVRVAVVDGQVGGLIVMWAEPDHFYVDNIAVDPATQGLGLGRLLLADADRAAMVAGQNEIRLYTNEAMTENLAYYPARGFIETHRGEESGYRRVYFSRRLGQS